MDISIDINVFGQGIVFGPGNEYVGGYIGIPPILPTKFGIPAYSSSLELTQNINSFNIFDFYKNNKCGN
jgi:hypothetical protein